MVDEESWSALILPDYCFVPHSQHVVNCAHPPTTISLEIKVGCIQIRLVFGSKNENKIGMQAFEASQIHSPTGW